MRQRPFVLSSDPHAPFPPADSAMQEPDGLLAVCIQHELDHLNGKLMVDYISSFKRTRIRKKLEKKHKEEAR